MTELFKVYYTAFALPVAIVAKCEEKIFLAQKISFGEKNFPPKKSTSYYKVKCSWAANLGKVSKVQIALLAIALLK